MRASFLGVLTLGLALSARAAGPLPEGIKLRPASQRVHPLPEDLGAFPGCTGAGCWTRGGFDTGAGTPAIYRVTSLATGTGAGTLGACIAASGPRVCVFAVAGEIAPASYTISNPYITIRGDTAPGKGISITRNGATSDADVLSVHTHDVVIRGIRVRNRGAVGTYGASAMSIYPASGANGAINGVILDHASVSWGTHQNFVIYSATGTPNENQPRDITLSWSMLAEGLEDPALGYSKSALIAGDRVSAYGNHAPSFADLMTDIDLHHDFFGNSKRRNPEIRLKTIRAINNVFYNWGSEGLAPYGAVTVDFIGNVGKRGPNTDGDYIYSRNSILSGVGYWINFDGADAILDNQTIWLDGNKLSGGAVQGWTGFGSFPSPTIVERTGASVCNGSSIIDHCRPSTWPVQASAPLSPAPSGPPIMATSADVAEAAVIAGVGHSRRLDCGGRWITTGVRDSTEERLVASYATPPSYFAFAGCNADPCWPHQVPDATGASGNNGFPVIPVVSSTCAATSRDNASCACADSDGDGIPDYWEKAFCGTTTACSPLATTVAPPWTNIEAFMSGLVVAP